MNDSARQAFLRPPLHVAAVAAAVLPLLLSSGVAAQAIGDPPEAQEELRRYQVEVILFRYDRSVTAGTEVFLPDPPPGGRFGAGLQGDGVPTGDDDGSPYFGDRPPAPGADGDALLRDPAGASGAQLPGTDSIADEDTAPEDDELPATLEEILTAASRIDLVVTPRGDLTLTGVYERLEQLDAYEPVLWSGWTQIVRDEESTPAIDLRRLGRVPLEFDGRFSLYLGRFVHLVVDIELEDYASGGSQEPYYGDRRRRDSEAYAAPGDRWTPRIRYRIREDSILRNGEMRYFDHPRFGLIAKLTLVEEEEPGDPLLDDSGDLLPAGGPGGLTTDPTGGQ